MGSSSLLGRKAAAHLAYTLCRNSLDCKACQGVFLPGDCLLAEDFKSFVLTSPGKVLKCLFSHTSHTGGKDLLRLLFVQAASLWYTCQSGGNPMQLLGEYHSMLSMETHGSLAWYPILCGFLVDAVPVLENASPIKWGIAVGEMHICLKCLDITSMYLVSLMPRNRQARQVRSRSLVW